MQAVTLGLNQQLAQQYNGIDPQPPTVGHLGTLGTAGAMDQAQLQQLVQLLGAKMLPKQTAVVECPKSMVGRVIGKGGETIKALQQYTGAMIQIDQSTDPTRVTIAGSPQSLQLAVSMVNDIVRGTFKGFAMLRQIAIGTQGGMAQFGQPQPVYVQGYGFVPPSQVYSPEEGIQASLMRTSPTGSLTPPLPGTMRPGAPPAGGNISADALAALLGQTQGAPPSGAPGMGGGMSPYGPGPSQPPAQQPGGGNDALIAQLLNQLASQGMPTPQMPVAPPPQPQAPPPQLPQAPSPQPGVPPGAGLDLSNLSGLDPATLQALLAQAGLLGGGAPAPGMPSSSPSPPPQGLPPSASLMMAAQAAGGRGAGTPPGMPPPSASPSTSPYSSGTHAGMLSMMMAAGGQHPLGSRPLSSAGSVGSPPGAGIVTPPPLAGSLGGGTPPPPGAGAAGTSTLTGLLAGTGAASSFLGTSPSSASSPASGSGRTSPAKPGVGATPTPGSNPATSLKSNSGESSPLGRFGAIGSGVGAVGAGAPAPTSAGLGAELLAAKMGALSTSDAVAASPPRAGAATPEAPLPPGWTKVSDAAQGLVFYVNQLTGESTLTPPAAPGTTNGVQNM